MANIRTANKRHKRAITATQMRNKAAEKAVVAVAKPAKAAR